jgi:hypothetical protein
MRQRALQYSIEVVPERFVGEVGPDIDKLHGEPFKAFIVSSPMLPDPCHGGHLHSLLARERCRGLGSPAPLVMCYQWESSYGTRDARPGGHR